MTTFSSDFRVPLIVPHHQASALLSSLKKASQTSAVHLGLLGAPASDSAPLHVTFGDFWWLLMFQFQPSQLRGLLSPLPWCAAKAPVPPPPPSHPLTPPRPLKEALQGINGHGSFCLPIVQPTSSVPSRWAFSPNPHPHPTPGSSGGSSRS